MSELKTYKMVDEMYCSDCVCVIPSEVYIKSEADNYIAELKERHKEEVDELQKATDSAWGKVNAMYDEILHQKYKRCFDKAKWCNAELWNIRNTPLRDMNTHELWQHDDEFWQRWHERWLELAYKINGVK